MPVEIVEVDRAAAALEISTMQVGRLIASGELRAQRVGRSWLVDLASLNRYRTNRAPGGRPLGPTRAWERLLAAKPTTIDEAISLAGQVRRRGVAQWSRVLPGLRDELARDSRVVCGGGRSAAAHGAAVDAGEFEVLYVKASDSKSLEEAYFIEDFGDPNLLLRVVDPEEWPFEHARAPAIVAVVDLVDIGEHRLAAEALRVIP